MWENDVTPAACLKLPAGPVGRKGSYVTSSANIFRTTRRYPMKISQECKDLVLFSLIKTQNFLKAFLSTGISEGEEEGLRIHEILISKLSRSVSVEFFEASLNTPRSQDVRSVVIISAIPRLKTYLRKHFRLLLLFGSRIVRAHIITNFIWTGNNTSLIWTTKSGRILI